MSIIVVSVVHCCISCLIRRTRMPIRAIWYNWTRMPISKIRVIRSFKKEKWLECLALLDFPTTLYRLRAVSRIWLHVTSLRECHAGTDSLESRWAYCFIWCADMAIAFKAACALNAFALQYVNSQCQHDSLPLKLAAKLHLFTLTSKFPTDYLISGVSLSALSEWESLWQNFTPWSS